MKNARTTRAPRGIALLVVLVTMVLLFALLTPFVESAALLARARREQRLDDACRDIVRSADPAIMRWLNRDSPRTPLAPDVRTPSVVVLDDTGQLGDDPFRITIIAFDQCGMTPVQLIGIDRTLSGSLPPDLQSMRTPAPPYGLDQLHADGRPTFPPNTPHSAPRDDAAVGALVATHNPPDQSDAAPAINVNTTPEPLLRAAFLSTGSGDPAPILAARARGSLASLRGGSPNSPSGIHLVTTSNCWSFRLDTRVGDHRGAWWFVYARRGSIWARVQSMPVTE